MFDFIKKHYSTLRGIFRHPGDTVRVKALHAHVLAGKDMVRDGGLDEGEEDAVVWARVE